MKRCSLLLLFTVFLLVAASAQKIDNLVELKQK